MNWWEKPGSVLQGAETDPETVAYLSNQIEKGNPLIVKL
jgi:hypothetical protein